MATDTTTKTQIEIIRQAVKAVAPRVKVVQGKGTAYGWVDIIARDYLNFTPAEREALNGIGLDLGGNTFCISPEERRKWAQALSLDQAAKFVHIPGNWD